MRNGVNVQDRIVTIFREKLHINDMPSAEANLVEMGILDSLTFIELLTCLENGFGVSISIEDLEIKNFSSIANIAHFVTASNGQKGHG